MATCPSIRDVGYLALSVCSGPLYFALISFLPWAYAWEQSHWAGFTLIALWMFLASFFISFWWLRWIQMLLAVPFRWSSLQTLVPAIAYSIVPSAALTVINTLGLYPFPFAVPLSSGLTYSTIIGAAFYLMLPEQVPMFASTSGSKKVSPCPTPVQAVNGEANKTVDLSLKKTWHFVKRYLLLAIYLTAANVYYFVCLLFLFLMTQQTHVFAQVLIIVGFRILTSTIVKLGSGYLHRLRGSWRIPARSRTMIS